MGTGAIVSAIVSAMSGIQREVKNSFDCVIIELTTILLSNSLNYESFVYMYKI